MMNAVQTIGSNKFDEIRTVEDGGKLWWVLSDVCKVLGLGNPHYVATKLTEEERGKQVTQTPGGPQKMIVVNESGLRKVIEKSKKQVAQPFINQVSQDMELSIKPIGISTTGQPDSLVIPPDYPSALRALADQIEKNVELARTNRLQANKIEVLEPKGAYYDIVLHCRDLLPISVIAKDYGKSGVWLNRFLRDRGIQYRQGNIWLLYQKYAGKGYTGTKTLTWNNDGEGRARVHTYWTQKGRLFIYDLMKTAGISPLVERRDRVRRVAG